MSTREQRRALIAKWRAEATELRKRADAGIGGPALPRVQTWEATVVAAGLKNVADLAHKVALTNEAHALERAASELEVLEAEALA